MNPGETRPWEADDGDLGEALQDRLSRLAARLERLTSDPRALTRTAGQPLADAQLASEAFAEDYPEARPARPREPASRHDTFGEKPTRSPARQEKAGLAEIAAALRDIERREPPAVSPESRETSRNHAGAEKRLQSIRQRIEALKSRQSEDSKPRRARRVDAEPAEVPEAPEPAEASEFGEASPGPAQYSRAAEFNAAIAEIAARQRDIDGSALPPITTRRREETPSAPRRSSERQLSDAVTDLRNRAEELSRESHANVRVQARDAAPRSGEPAQQQSSALGALERQLANIQRQLEASPSASDVTAIAAGNEAILERIDGLLSRTPENGFESFAQQIIHRVPSSDRFDALIAEVDRLSERISNIGGRDDFARIEARVMGLYEQLASTNPAARVETEIAGLRDALDHISGMLGDSSNPALDRLEARLDQISERLDTTLAVASRPEDTADLFGRLETMARRSEAAPEALEALASEIAGLRARERSELANLDSHIQALATRLDEAILGQASGEVAIADLDGKLGALSGRLDELAEATPSAERMAAIDQVDEQVRQLADRLDQIAVSDQTTDAMADLEAQVAVLMERLERLSADHNTLQEVQQNLTRVETLVTSADTNSMRAIQQAAREAVSELSGVAGPNARIVEELRADLRELQTAADSKEQQTTGTLDTVHQTLDRVVARLGSLEEDVRGRGAPATAEPASSTPLPATDPSHHLRRRADSHEADDQPLAPGSNRARSNEKPSSDRDRRADFIAAARRAAQAAAAEHGAMRQTLPSEEVDGDESAGEGSRVGRLIRNNRRPLLLAVGAIVLAIAAFQVAKPLFGSSSNEAPPNQSANLENEAALAAPAPVVDPVADDPPVVVIAPPEEAAPAVGAAPVEETAPPAASPVAEAPAPMASPAPQPAFMPPAGVTSPVNAPAAADVPAAATAYGMPEELIGGVRLRVAAAEGDAAALYEVGARYADGIGVPRDLTEAAIWLERAAEAGLAVAQHRLAAMYEAGLGVDENRPIALQWYTAAAEQGNVLAMHNIGVMYSQGIEGTPDFTSAVEWFTSAADHGIRDSQYNLGVIYARGIGVDADYVAAYKWFALAAAQGDTDAAARRDEVAATLTPEELASARASVSAWSAQTAPAAANTVEVPEGGWDAPEERAELGDGGDLVRTIQALLANHGFDPGPADGVVGPMTRDAARAFQQAIGVPATGELDETLLDALTEQAA